MPRNNKAFVIILNTCPSQKEAKKIAKILVAEKLAACVNISSPVQSIYSWKGKICSENEYLLIIKSKKSLFKKIKNRIQQLHLYECPEIIALPILQGSEDYLAWISKNTQ